MNSKKGSQNSYSDILKASSIIGGAHGINYLISMVKVKLVAILLGPSGVGLIGLYNSATTLIGTLTGLGISTSGIREVAEAYGQGNPVQIARTIKTLQRASLVTGVLGWIITASLSYPLSIWVFGSGGYALEIAILGVTLTLGAISGGQNAMIQGTRRIGDLARLNVFVAIVGAIIAVSIYAWLGSNGIVPVLVATAVINLGFTWWLVQRIETVQIDQTWVETLQNSRRLVQLGLAFMYGGLLSAIVGLALRVLIVRNLGIDSNGIYQAAWGISGMFAGFILTALGTDFYPRLTAVAHDNKKVNCLVGEQIEIGILLALPGLVGTLVFAPWLMKLFYSAKFIQGADVLSWLVLGVFGQIILFPIGTIMRAKGSARWIYIGQTEANVVHLLLCIIFVPIYGILGAGYAFIIHTIIHGVVVNMIATHISGFKWGRNEIFLTLYALIFILIAFVLSNIVNIYQLLILGTLLLIFSCIFSLRGIVQRLDQRHKVVKIASSFYLLRCISGIKNKEVNVHE